MRYNNKSSTHIGWTARDDVEVLESGQLSKLERGPSLMERQGTRDGSKVARRTVSFHRHPTDKLTKKLSEKRKTEKAQENNLTVSDTSPNNRYIFERSSENISGDTLTEEHSITRSGVSNLDESEEVTNLDAEFSRDKPHLEQSQATSHDKLTENKHSIENCDELNTSNSPKVVLGRHNTMPTIVHESREGFPYNQIKRHDCSFAKSSPEMQRVSHHLASSCNASFQEQNMQTVLINSCEKKTEDTKADVHVSNHAGDTCSSSAASVSTELTNSNEGNIPSFGGEMINIKPSRLEDVASFTSENEKSQMKYREISDVAPNIEDTGLSHKEEVSEMVSVYTTGNSGLISDVTRTLEHSNLGTDTEHETGSYISDAAVTLET